MYYNISVLYINHYPMKRKSFLAKRVERKSRRKFFFTLLVVIVVLYGLVTWFLPALINSLSILNRFKPQSSSQPLSVSSSLAPPVLNIPYEATNTATIKIKGYASPRSRVEIYVDEELKTVADAPDGNFTSEDIPLSLGTNNIYGKTIDDKGHTSLPSKPIRIFYSNEKPKLEISSPSDNQTVQDRKITVSGTTNADRDIMVTAQSSRAIVNQDGNFSQTINLNEGDNDIVVIATDPSGNTTQITRRVAFQPQP